MNCVHWKSALISVFVQKMRRHDKVRWMHTNFFFCKSSSVLCEDVSTNVGWHIWVCFFIVYIVWVNIITLHLLWTHVLHSRVVKKICTICSFSLWMTNRSECNWDIVFVNCATRQKCLLIVAVVVMLHNEANRHLKQSFPCCHNTYDIKWLYI